LKAFGSLAALTLATSLQGCGLDLIYADWKVNRLCKEDGGIKIHIQDRPPIEFRRPDGKTDVDALLLAKPQQSYYFENIKNDVQSGEPRIFRSEYRLVRRVDGAILGSSVTYYRVGQNTSIPLLSHKGYKCPSENEVNKLVESVFTLSDPPQ